MRNPFDSECKTDKEILRILIKAHLELVNIDPAYMPNDVYEKKEEYVKVLLRNIHELCPKCQEKEDVCENCYHFEECSKDWDKKCKKFKPECSKKGDEDEIRQQEFDNGFEVGMYEQELKKGDETEDWTDEEIELYHRTGDVPLNGVEK